MPYRVSYCCISFLMLVLWVKPVSAQTSPSKLIGVEAGLHVNLLQDALISPYRYKGSQLQLAAMRYKSRKERSSLEIGVERSGLDMRRVNFDDRVSPERLSSSNYGVSIAWHRRLSPHDARVHWSAGLRNQIQGSITNISIPTFGGTLSNSDSYQLAIGNLALSGQVHFAAGEGHQLFAEAAYTLYY